MIYLDNSATSHPKPLSVINAVKNSLLYFSANPGRSGHSMSMKAANQVYSCRKTVSRFFNMKDESKVIFTASCTQALNTVIKGILKPGDHCIVSCFEHNSVIRPLEKLKSKNVSYSVAKVYSADNDKTVDSFRNCINERTKLIICTHASNVFGIRLPVERLCALAHEYGALFCLDAAQSSGVFNIDISENNYDFVCCAGHKGLYGPMGIGLLLINTDYVMDTLIEGGTGSVSTSLLQPQFCPDRYESGTLNIPGICGLEKGIDFVEKIGVDKIYEKEISHISNLCELLKRNKNIIIYTENPIVEYNAPVLSFSYKDTDSESLAAYLNKEYSIAVRAGLHCSPLAHEYMNTKEYGTVRVSPSYFTTNKDILLFINAINKFKKLA